MSNKYKPSFGIEIHVTLDTRTKAFSPAEHVFNAKPNSKIHPLDVGYPGAKPKPNKKVVEYAIRLATVLHMDIDRKLRFDRKNYFYPDLPLGYQITQFEHPIGKNGKFQIVLEDGQYKYIKITDIHIEHDTAKQFKKDGKMYLDFNRSGAPLIEIVSGHEDLETIEEVITYVKQLREQLVVLGISRAILAEGTFRVDINVSLRKEDVQEFGTRTEIKNLNSFENIKTALEYEIALQTKTLDQGKKVEMVTKRFDQTKQQTVTMRKKTSDLYNFIPEGNINPIYLSDKFMENALKKQIWTHLQAREKFLKVITKEEYDILTQAGPLFNFFLQLAKKTSYQEASKFIIHTLLSKIKSQKNFLNKNYFNNLHAEIMVKLLSENKITNSEVLKLIDKVFDDQNIEEDLEKFKNVKQLQTEDIDKLIDKIISSNPQVEEDIKQRPDRVQKFIMGQLMKETKGQVNAKEANKIIAKKITK